MAHTGSFDTEGSRRYSPDAFRDGAFLCLRPGETYSYSNLGYGVLSVALERAAGRAFNDMAKDWVFAPLGVDASFICSALADASDIGALNGEDGGMSVAELADVAGYGPGMDMSLACGNLIISAGDYLLLLDALNHEGLAYTGERVLSPERTAELLRERAKTELGFGVAYGSQIQTNVIGGERVYVHTGSAFGMYSAYCFNLETKKAAVAFTIGEQRWMDPDTEVYYLCQELFRAVW